MDLFRPDNPVSIKSEDRFQRYVFAQRIAEIISVGNRPSSLTVGIYGKWGEGKTSVINFIKEALPVEVVIVNFNPWSFSDDKQLITSFLGNIATALGKKLTTKKDRVLKAFKGYADSIGAISSFIHSGTGEIVKSGADFADKLQKNTLEDYKNRIDELIIKADSNFIIFIDDIDRLEAHEVQAIFRLVKLLGDFPRTAYVLSFDDDMVAAALGPKYGNGDKKSGYDFLEKIIHVPLQLPKANRQTLRTYTFELLNKASDLLNIGLDKNESADFLDKFDRAFLPALINPRLAVRYANSISFSLPLLKGEVNLSDLIIIEGIKVFYPVLYHFIRNTPEYFTRNYSNTNTVISTITKEEKESVKAAILEQINMYQQKDKILLLIRDLFPQLRTVLLTHDYRTENPEEWYRKKRICSPHYFERYFSYVVQEGDISDVYFQGLFSGLENLDIQTIITQFEDALPKMKADTFIFKLRQFIPTFNKAEAKIIAIILSRFGDYYSKIPGVIFYSGGREQVSSIIREILETIPKEDRIKPCIEVLEEAQPIEFAMQIQRRYRVESRYDHEPSFLEAAELKQIAEVLVERFLKQSSNESIFSLMADEYLWGMFELFIEAAKQKEAEELLSNYFLTSEENALKIIKIFTPEIVSTARDTLDPYKVYFKKDNYNLIKRFIDPNLIYTKTIQVYGKKEYLPGSDPMHDELTDENLIGIFQKLHEETF